MNPNTNQDQKLERLAEIYQEYQAKIDNIQKQRWDEFVDIMKDMDKEEIEKVRNQIFNQK
ncbi:MAG: hypothetical protein ABIH67_03160 [Candidatus Uhrbacteria bacterium]